MLFESRPPRHTNTLEVSGVFFFPVTRPHRGDDIQIPPSSLQETRSARSVFFFPVTRLRRENVIRILPSPPHKHARSIGRVLFSVARPHRGDDIQIPPSSLQETRSARSVFFFPVTRPRRENVIRIPPSPPQKNAFLVERVFDSNPKNFLTPVASSIPHTADYDEYTPPHTNTSESPAEIYRAHTPKQLP